MAIEMITATMKAKVATSEPCSPSRQACRRRKRRAAGRSRAASSRTSACAAVSLIPAAVPAMARATARGSNGRRSSAFSPTPIAWIGRPNFSAAATSTPPRAVPSSLVMIRPVTPGALAEHLDLRKRVLAGGRIEHEQDVVRRFRVEAAEHAADLGQFLHQVRLVLEAAGGVDDQRVDAGRGRLLDAVEHDPGGIAAFLAGNDRRADAVAPDLELLDRRGAEGVAGGEQDAIILFLQPVAELADRGGLARAVDADHQDDVRARKAPDFQRLGDGSEDLLDLLGEDRCEGRARRAARTSGAAMASRMRCDASGPRSDAISASSMSSSVAVSSACSVDQAGEIFARRGPQSS